MVAQGRKRLEEEVRERLEGEAAAGLSPRIQALVSDLLDDWMRLDGRIKAFDAEFIEMARTDEAMRRLSTVPGIGPVNATALAAAVGDARAFAKPGDEVVVTAGVPFGMPGATNALRVAVVT